MKVFVQEIKNYEGKEVVLMGWVANIRSSGKIYFIQFRDGTGFLQAVADEAVVSKESWEEIKKTTIESAIELQGVVSKYPKRDEYELQVKKLVLLSGAEEYPIGKKDHGPDFLLDFRHLWLRSPRQWAIQRVRNTIINATYEFLNKEKFIKVDSPILTPTSCEGTTTLFEVDYFGEKAYLAQSGQLYLEAAIFSLGRVFDFGPVFRAEKSKTRRHLIEFWMMDAEAAFVEHEENLKIQENLISFIVKEVLDNNGKELKILERDSKILKNIKPPFYRLTHAEAVKKLKAEGSDIGEMNDLGGDDETILAKMHDKPVFVEKYPAAVKAFYMKRDPEDSSRVLNADLLAPEGYGEIIGGSEREDNYEELLKRMKEHKMPIEPFQWYLDTRRYGSVPHSGFGYGLERIVAWICGLEHVRESIPFPRLLNRMRP